MIPSITYENIIRELRTQLAIQSGVPLDYIFNAVSVRGPDIYKLISNTQSASFSLAESFIIFELNEDDTEDNVVLHELDNSLSSISSFNLNLKIYGNGCHAVSQNILMRFKGEEVAIDLREKGIFINRITFPTNINEFINNTVWPRCDMAIKIKVRFNTPKITTSGDAETINEIIINHF